MTRVRIPVGKQKGVWRDVLALAVLLVVTLIITSPDLFAVERHFGAAPDATATPSISGVLPLAGKPGYFTASLGVDNRSGSEFSIVTTNTIAGPPPKLTVPDGGTAYSDDICQGTNCTLDPKTGLSFLRTSTPAGVDLFASYTFNGPTGAHAEFELERPLTKYLKTAGQCLHIRRLRNTAAENAFLLLVNPGGVDTVNLITAAGVESVTVPSGTSIYQVLKPFDSSADSTVCRPVVGPLPDAEIYVVGFIGPANGGSQKPRYPE